MAEHTYNLKWSGPSSLKHSNKGGFQFFAAQTSCNCDFAETLTGASTQQNYNIMKFQFRQIPKTKGALKRE